MKIDQEGLRIASEYIEKFGYNPERHGAPTGYDYNEWVLYLLSRNVSEKEIETLAFNISNRIEDSEMFAVERVLSRMGWPEIHAYEKEWNNGQQDDDAGGYWIRCLSRLFGVKRKLRCAAELGRHKRACRAMVQSAADVEAKDD